MRKGLKLSMSPENQARNHLWVESSLKGVKAPMDFAVTNFRLDKAFNFFTPLELALADDLFETAVASYGINTSMVSLETSTRMYIQAFGVECSTNPNSFTANHESLTVRKRILDSTNHPMEKFGILSQMCMFVNQNGSPTLGDVSPIILTEQDGRLLLSYTTPNGNAWTKEIEVIPVSVDPNELGCASEFHISVLAKDCPQQCSFCDVPFGDGFLTDDQKEEIERSLDRTARIAIEKNRPLRFTLSGGSPNTPYAGFEWAEFKLELIKQKAEALKGETGKTLRVQGQIEMMLPDKELWQEVISKLNGYRDLGWKISLAINLEVLDNADRPFFMPGKKGTFTLEDHIEFASVLSERTGGEIVMNSLVLFLKRNNQSYEDYMLKQIPLFQKLIDVGIHPELAPARISSKSRLRLDPASNFVYYMIQHLMLQEMKFKVHQKRSFGCVSCNACHQYQEALKLLHIVRKNQVEQKNSLPAILGPVLKTIGDRYKEAFTQIFSI